MGLSATNIAGFHFGPITTASVGVANVKEHSFKKGINMTFNNLIEIIVEICEIALSNRATPGSSLVLYIYHVFQFARA